MKYVKLNNGIEMPILGFGVFQIKDFKQCEETVQKALNIGYRLIDTAQSYGNEAAVGNAIKNSRIPREEIFVTTKLKVANISYENAKKSFFASMEKLQLDYLDMLLIHHPYNDVFGAWKAMRELQDDGYVRAIGISNFPEDRLEDLILHGGKTPQLMQMEMHPFNQQKSTLKLLQNKRIYPEAWGPLAQGKFGIFDNDVLEKIAKKHCKTIAQVVLRWLVQLDVAVIPKSIHEERLKENFDIFNFNLSEEEMELISKLNQNATVTPQMREPYWIDNLSSF